MPQNQQLVNLLAASGAIRHLGGPRPTFQVNYSVMRGVLGAEQAAMAAANPPVKQRRDEGAMTLVPPGAAIPVVIPTIIVLGANGLIARGGRNESGESVILAEPKKSGHILIAAGGSAANPTAARLTFSGGDATAIGDAENLIVALGGNGNSPVGAPGGGDGAAGGPAGNAVAIGTGAGNDLYAQGGDGGFGAPGGAGTPAALGVVGLLPAIPGGPGGFGGPGGPGGKAYVVGGENSFGEPVGGNGGPGGAGGPGGPGVAAPGLGGIGAPGGGLGLGGAGGDGGNVRLELGLNSLSSAGTKPGVVGVPGPGSRPGPPGTPGIVEL
jgi:hypothetical protein